MLGVFHLTKTALHCAGLFLKGSRVEDIFIEYGIFGPKTVDSGMDGKNHYRSLEGLTIFDPIIEDIQHILVTCPHYHQLLLQLEEPITSEIISWE